MSSLFVNLRGREILLFPVVETQLATKPHTVSQSFTPTW